MSTSRKSSITDAGPTKSSPFRKVGECLYRNESSKVYFALLKIRGKQVRKSLETKDRDLAKRRLKDMRDVLVPRVGDALDRKLNFREVAKQWYDLRTTHLKNDSRDRVQRNIKELNKAFGGLQIMKISKVTCERWAAERGENISASTFNKDAGVLKQILDYAVEHGALLANPAVKVKWRKVKDKKPTIPTRDQFEKLLEALTMLPRDKGASHLVKLLAFSGMRLGEATDLYWRDIDFERKIFAARAGEDGTKNLEERSTPLFPLMEELLLEIRGNADPDPNTRVLRIKEAKNSINAACKLAGLPHFNHHILRHYFVSNAIEAGVDFKTIAEWVGHKDGGTLVVKTYGHLRQEHSMKMAQLIR